MASEEDKAWEGGQCSGTMYCGDHDHYEFMADAFKLFAHVNVLQRDICPSASKFEGEIIAMTLDMLHGDAVHDTTPAASSPAAAATASSMPCTPTASTRVSTAASSGPT